MKLKKLLAGVLSATMVATMIPASMAFSGVSAAEDTGNGLVVSYDLTTNDGRSEWTKCYGLGRNDTATDTRVMTEGADGVTFTNEYNAYSISNPLKGEATDGFTVIVDVSVPSTQAQNEFEGLFGFNSHGMWDWFGVTNSGLTMNMNAVASPYTQRFFDLNAVAPVATTDMRDARYVLTVDADSITVYVNGQQIEQYSGTAGKLADDTTADVTYGQAVMALVNVAEYFDLGYWRNQGDWGAFSSAMTVGGVSFYNTTMTEDEVEAEYIASQLDLEVIGMQAGTINDTSAIRFVANMDSSAVDTNNASIVNVGWAWEMKAATADWGEYQSAQVTTVTSDPSLTSETGKYAYTLVCESGSAEDYYSAVPYVVIEVNSNNYTFCYNGRGASYVSDASALVYAPADFAEVSTQA